MKAFEIQTDKTEILAKFRELAKKLDINFTERDLDKFDNPSPSNDPFYDNPENIAHITEGIKQMKEGKVVNLTDEELRKILEI